MTAETLVKIRLKAKNSSVFGKNIKINNGMVFTQIWHTIHSLLLLLFLIETTILYCTKKRHSVVFVVKLK